MDWLGEEEDAFDLILFGGNVNGGRRSKKGGSEIFKSMHGGECGEIALRTGNNNNNNVMSFRYAELLLLLCNFALFVRG